VSAVWSNRRIGVMTHRFFVPADCVREEQVEFTEDQRKQMRNVLRLRAGDVVAALDGSGREFVVKIGELSAGRAAGEILETRTPDTEAPVRLTVIQGLPKGERLDFILQKCTEIGAAEFVIMESARSVPRVASDKLPARLQRWNAIVREAAEQSGRTRLPTVEGILSFDAAVERAKMCDAAFIAWEGERETTLLSRMPRIRRAKSVAYLVGPEGGFTEAEIARAKTGGIAPVSLGPRVLRTETAAMVGAALITYGTEEQAFSE
jgi:16S rRNA (uracil1498-N3)-methyltransferase